MSGAIEELYLANDQSGLSPHAGMQALSDTIAAARLTGQTLTAHGGPAQTGSAHAGVTATAELLRNPAPAGTSSALSSRSVTDAAPSGPQFAPTMPVASSGPTPGSQPLLVVVERGREDEVRIGPMLRQRREQMGISLAQATERTRIPVVHLEALESMNIKAIPQGFGTGYAKSYAEFLGLHPDSVVNRLRAESGLLALAREVTPETRAESGGRGAPAQALLAVAAILGVAGFVGWSLLVGDSGAKDGSAVIVDAPAVPRTVLAGPDYSRRVLEIQVLRPAFLEARGPDGVVYLARVMRPGETLSPQLGAGWRLTSPDGGAFGVRIDERPLTPLGPDGTAVIGWRVDDALAAPPPVAEASLAATASGTTSIANTPAPVAN